MTIRTELWDDLGFSLLSELDGAAAEYHSGWLSEAARRLKAGEPLGPMAWQLGDCLEQLAAKPMAIKALNHRKHKDQAPGELFALNVAVHFLALLELLGEKQEKRAQQQAALWWAVAETSVADYLTVHREDGRRLLDEIVGYRPGLSRRAVLEQLDAAMRKRAKLPWFQRRKKGAKPDQKPKDEAPH